MDTTQKKTIIISLGIVLSVLTFYFAHLGLSAVSFPATTTQLTLNVSNSSVKDKYKLWFADQHNPMSELSSVETHDSTTAFRDIVFKVPLNFKPSQIKLTFGGYFPEVKIKSLTLTKGNTSVVWDAQTIYQNFTKTDINTLYEYRDGLVCIKATTDAFPAIISRDAADILPIVCYENTWRPLWYALMLSILVFAIWHFLFLARFTKTTQGEVSNQPSAERRIHQYSLGVLFIVILLLPLLVFKALEDPETIKAEKRNRAGFPKIRVSTLLNYTPGLNDFLNDNFGGRNLIIQGHALLYVKLFHVSPLKSKVEIGRNNRLFFVGDDTKEYSQNRFPLTETQLKKMRQTVVENYEWLKLKGIAFYLIFPPLPQNVYAEDLPQNLRRFNDVSKIRQFITYLRQSTNLNIIEVEQPLRQSKKYFPLYLKEDTHWNYIGAYIAYRQMHKVISNNFAIGEPYTSKNLTLTTVDNGIGDLESMMGLPYIQPNMHTLLSPPKQVSEEYFDSSEQVKAFSEGKVNSYWVSVKHKQNTRLPKLLLYRDSYSIAFKQLFLDHFSHSTLVWGKDLNPAEVNYVKPDLVVFEMLERFSPLLEKGNLPSIKEELRSNGIVVDDAYFAQHASQKIKSTTAQITVH